MLAQLMVIYISTLGQSSMTIIPMVDMGKCSAAMVGLRDGKWEAVVKPKSTDGGEQIIPGTLYAKCNPTP